MANPLSKLRSLFHKPAVLELDLARGVIEIRPDGPLQALQAINATTMAALRDALTAAAKDDHVKGLIVHTAGANIPASVLDEIALEIERFGEHKPTVAWTETFGELVPSLAMYKMATAANEIWVHPTGMLTIDGYEAQMVLLKGGLDKLGVEPEFGQRHEYKTAANTYSADEFTDAHREMTESLVADLVHDAINVIADRRGLEEGFVREALESSPVTPERALEIGLIDHIGYRDEVYDAVLTAWGAEREELRFVNRYEKPQFLKPMISRNKKKIGIVPIRGGIVVGRGAPSLGGPSAGSDFIDEQLRAALGDDDIVAVILDVDSPGGSAVASDFIRRSVQQVRESGRKVVARMGNVAASGGYYVSMGADEIVALPSTLTGSIGVLGGKFVTQGLFDKIGLKRETVRATENGTLLDATQPYTEHDWERLNDWLDRVYLDFTSKAAEDRGMEYEELEALARGRVWTGAQALEHGLVDYVGGRRVAQERAAALAGVDLDDVDIVPVGHAGLLAKLMPATSSESVGAPGASAAVTPESMLNAMLRRAGVHVDGALTLPFGFRIR